MCYMMLYYPSACFSNGAAQQASWRTRHQCLEQYHIPTNAI